MINDAKSEEFGDNYLVSAGVSGSPFLLLIGSSLNVAGGRDFKTTRRKIFE